MTIGLGAWSRARVKDALKPSPSFIIRFSLFFFTHDTKTHNEENITFLGHYGWKKKKKDEVVSLSKLFSHSYLSELRFM